MGAEMVYIAAQKARAKGMGKTGMIGKTRIYGKATVVTTAHVPLIVLKRSTNILYRIVEVIVEEVSGGFSDVSNVWNNSILCSLLLDHPELYDEFLAELQSMDKAAYNELCQQLGEEGLKTLAAVAKTVEGQRAGAAKILEGKVETAPIDVSEVVQRPVKAQSIDERFTQLEAGVAGMLGKFSVAMAEIAQKVDDFTKAPKERKPSGLPANFQVRPEGADAEALKVVNNSLRPQGA